MVALKTKYQSDPAIQATLKFLLSRAQTITVRILVRRGTKRIVTAATPAPALDMGHTKRPQGTTWPICYHRVRTPQTVTPSPHTEYEHNPKAYARGCVDNAQSGRRFHTFMTCRWPSAAAMSKAAWEQPSERLVASQRTTCRCPPPAAPSIAPSVHVAP